MVFTTAFPGAAWYARESDPSGMTLRVRVCGVRVCDGDTKERASRRVLAGDVERVRTVPPTAKAEGGGGEPAAAVRAAKTAPPAGATKDESTPPCAKSIAAVART